MASLTIQDMNVTGLDGVLIYIANAVPIFIPTLLIAIWIGVTTVIYFGTRKFGQGDIFVAFAAGGFLTFVIGVIMTLSFGIINNYTLVTIAGILIVSALIGLTKRNRD